MYLVYGLKYIDIFIYITYKKISLPNGVFSGT